ncbi:hypothetical protein [Candidatus Berkiella aquae]|uniref:Uncharacterized protein n=1 Tax=Candidatus Berkiella aquae TaxID=295108 RepID=A0A0Q9YZ20_9GAMM|nr:hypothetical protein [Candidatus Berkiella aquae]MCS5711010.1 hypothetical protein [Candidatus Berkiella aquae]
MSLEFYTALQANKLDSSEFILLLMGYAQEVEGVNSDELSSILNQAFKSYVCLNYQEAKEILISFLISKKNKVDPKILETAISRKASLNDSPNDNHNRRFFETLLAKVIKKNTKSYDSINKMLDTMKASSKYTKENLEKLPKARNYEEAMNILRYIHSFEATNSTQSMKEEIKDKLTSQAMYSKMVYTAQKSEPAESRNRGIMKSTTPNFYDFLYKKNKKMRHPDATYYNAKGQEDFMDMEESEGENEVDYFKNHSEIPFVESLSGTTCSLVGILLLYLDEHKNEPTELLNEDINNIIKLFMAYLIEPGFHSLGEVTAILEADFVKEQLNRYGVKIDLSFSEKDKMEMLEPAILYTKTSCIKKTMHHELEENVQRHRMGK